LLLVSTHLIQEQVKGMVPVSDKSGWRCRSASDMPVEWLMQCMSFLSLPDKYMCRSVCKKWFVAGREVLKDQEELVLSLEKLPQDCELDPMNAMHFMSKPKRVPAAGPSHTNCQSQSLTDSHVSPEEVIKLLGHLKLLAKIIIADDMTAINDWFVSDSQRMRREKFNPLFFPIVLSLIPSHSQSLTSLDMGNNCLPSDMNQSVVFVHLKELKCRLMTEQDISRCPKLRKLTVCYTSALQHLPIEKMHELNLLTASVFSAHDLPDYDYEDMKNKEMNQLLLVVSRLTNLKVLRIGLSQNVIDFSDESSSFKKKLLQNMMKLEVLSLTFVRSLNDDNKEYDEDELMEQLAHTNPNIREIENMYLTEKGIQSLSSLKHLERICNLRVSSSDQIIPAVLTILTGGSGHCLQIIRVGIRRLPYRFPECHIRTELDRVLQEAGLPFKVTNSDDILVGVTRIK
jgi:hypothetical protein